MVPEASAAAEHFPYNEGRIIIRILSWFGSPLHADKIGDQVLNMLLASLPTQGVGSSGGKKLLKDLGSSLPA